MDSRTLKMLRPLFPFHLLWAAVGILHWRVTPTDRNKLKFFVPAVIYTCLLLGFVNTATFFTLEEAIGLRNTNLFEKTNVTILFALGTCLLPSVVNVLLVTTLLHREREMRLFETLNRINKKLIIVERPKKILGLYCGSMISFFSFVTYKLVYSAQFFELPYNSMTFYFAHLLAMTFGLKLIYIILAFQQQFEKINILIKTTLWSRSAATGDGLLQTDIHHAHMCTMLSMRRRLIALTREISQVYGTQCLVLLAYYIEQLVVNPFLGIFRRKLFKWNFDDGVDYLALHFVIRSLIALSQLIVLLWSCSTVKEEAANTRKIISLLINPLKASHFRDLEQYLLQVNNNNFDGIVIKGLVQLELPLAVKMISAITTILVVFLQI